MKITGTDLDLRAATLPGFSDRPNEDYVGATRNVVVVLDGAGIPRELPTGCEHSVHWFVQRLGAAILSHTAATDSVLDEGLRKAIMKVRGLHADSCDLEHPNSPSATVIIIRVTGQLEALVLADSTLVIRHADDRVTAVTDDRLDALVNRLKRDKLPRRPGLPDYRNQAGGFWVAGADPASADQALLRSWPIADVAAVALLTDGAARIVDLFHDQTWPEVLATIKSAGPAAVLDRVRIIEETDPGRLRWPRAKANDDATIAYVELS